MMVVQLSAIQIERDEGGRSGVLEGGEEEDAAGCDILAARRVFVTGKVAVAIWVRPL